MAGLGIIIPRNGGGGGGPVTPADLRLIDGTFFLVDPANSVDPWPAGVPASGASLPNLARDIAGNMGITGEKDAIFHNSMTTPANGVVERTAKGGLHGLITAANVPAAGQGSVLAMPPSIGDYLLAHTDHKWFFSVWLHLTRPRADTGGTSRAPVTAVSSSSSDANNRLFAVNTAAVAPSLGIGGRTDGALNEAGRKHFNRAVEVWSGTIPGAATLVRHVFRIGRPNNSASTYGLTASQPSLAGAPSWAFYSAWAHDMTVSGKTYAELDALDLQAFNIAFGTDGRYAGDTFTDPATIA